MREAQKMAVNGHLAALEAFRAGMSEFDINVSYLQSTGHRDTNVPYGNIVALNENAAVLHYTKLQQTVPNELLSFLIDSSKITFADSFAMSTAVSTEIPTSDAFMAAASLMPSPM